MYKKVTMFIVFTIITAIPLAFNTDYWSVSTKILVWAISIAPISGFCIYEIVQGYKKEGNREYTEYCQDLINRWVAYKDKNERLKSKGLEAYRDMYHKFPIKEQELLRSLGEYLLDGESWEIFKIMAKEMELKNKNDNEHTPIK